MSSSLPLPYVLIKPEKELSFYVSLVELTDQGSSDPKAQALIDAIQLPERSSDRAHRPTEKAIEHTNEQLQKLWKFLSEAREDAEGYNVLAMADFETFQQSAFAHIFSMLHLDLALIQSLGESFSEFELLLGSARLIAQLQLAETISGSTDVRAIDAQTSMIAEQIGHEQVTERIREGTLDTLVYLHDGLKFVKVPLEQTPMPSRNWILMIEPTLNSTTLFRLTEDGTLREYWHADSNQYRVDEQGMLQVSDWTAFQQFFMPITTLKSTEVFVPTGQSEQLWQQLKHKMKLLINRRDSKRRKLDLEQWHAIAIHDQLSSVTPAPSQHVVFTVTGYCLSLLGLMESQDKYIDSKRRSTYREHLRSHVQSLMKRK
jgi:hypothetical protein